MVRELRVIDIQQISGGNVLADLQSLGLNGLTHPEKTLGVFCISSGIILGSILPSVLGVVVGFAAIGGWVAYDIYVNNASTTNTNTSTAS